MEELFKKINIKPKDLKLYNTAFSHSSYANEQANFYIKNTTFLKEK